MTYIDKQQWIKYYLITELAQAIKRTAKISEYIEEMQFSEYAIDYGDYSLIFTNLLKTYHEVEVALVQEGEVVEYLTLRGKDLDHCYMGVFNLRYNWSDYGESYRLETVYGILSGDWEN